MRISLTAAITRSSWVMAAVTKTGELSVAGHTGSVSRVTTPGGWRSFSQAYSGQADQVREVRASLRKVLDGCPMADDAVLLTSELAANAVMHSDSKQPDAEFVLRAEIFEGKYLRVEVEDQGGPWDLGFGRDSGRWHGLDLVDEMASDWGREGDSAGWVVWFRLDWPPPWEAC
jgi:anti-sigma regulatory factor (Ser/Thr protein kinase)